ncbi:MAG: hypothetical protein KJ607_12040, partial [Bacteroidetes bacterium]|nr:hypothetical protein [Bacteroidota bacterium]
ISIGTKINSTTGGQQQTDNGIIEKYCYNNNIAYCDTLGGLYEWNEAKQYSALSKGVCPAGWHIPSKTEWSTLSSYLGGDGVSGGKIKQTGTANWSSPNTGATNSSGFTGLAGGVRNYSDGSIYNKDYYGGFWSSTESTSNWAWYRMLEYDSDDLLEDDTWKNTGWSVRCLKN